MSRKQKPYIDDYEESPGTAQAFSKAFLEQLAKLLAFVVVIGMIYLVVRFTPLHDFVCESPAKIVSDVVACPSTTVVPGAISIETQPITSVPSVASTYNFSGTLNYDNPTPTGPIPLHEVALAKASTLEFTFNISPVREDCGYWWRIDAQGVSTPVYYFGGHITNAATHTDSTELPAGNYKIQVGVSYTSGSTCTGSATYSLTVNVN